MQARVSIDGSDVVGGTQIEVGGHRIEGAVRSLEISQQAGYAARISLDLAVFDSVNVEGEVTVVMTETARDALVKLGWMPPPDPS